jgi:hypothetical protein
LAPAIQGGFDIRERLFAVAAVLLMQQGVEQLVFHLVLIWFHGLRF